jgi:anti-sigma factor RsiW
MQHIEALIDDYVLDLLSGPDREALRRHAAACSPCGERLAAEEARVRALVDALRRASAAEPERLAALYPGARRPAARPFRPARWRMVATVTLLGLAVLGGVLNSMRHTGGWWLATYTPTASLVTASPTAHRTPTLGAMTVRPAWTQLALQPVCLGTPAPVEPVPEPRPNSAAPRPVW